MAKEKKVKEKGKKGKRGLKAVIIIFSILCVIAASVVLGLTYWPSSGEKIANVLIEFNQDFKDKDGVKQYNDCVVKFTTANKEKTFQSDFDNYNDEMGSYEEVVNLLLKVTAFYGENFESTFNDSVRKREEKELSSSLSDFEVNIQKMSEYLEEHEDDLSTTDLICTGWGAIRDYYKNVIEDAVKISSKLETLSNKKLQGVYGNAVLPLSIKAVRSYFEVIEDKFFEKESLNSTEATACVANLKKFINTYFNGTKSIEYNFNEGLQKTIENVSKLETGTDGKVNFYYLISKNFSTEENFSEAQSVYIDAANKFLKGEV